MPSSSPTRLRTRPGELGCRAGLVADEEHGVAGSHARRRAQLLKPLRIQELGDRPLGLAVARARSSPGPARPGSWANATIWSKKLRGRPTAAGAGIARTTAPFSTAPGEDLEAGAAEHLGDVGDLRSGCAGPACRCRTSASRRDRRCRGNGVGRRPRQSGELRRTGRASPARPRRTRRPASRSSSRCRAGRTRPGCGRRARPRRESTARSGSSGRSPEIM